MIKIKTFLLATLLLTGLVFPATAQIGEPRSNFSVGVNGGVNLNSASFTPTIKQNSLMGITGGLTARYISEKYFAMICGAQVELNISQRGWDELFEMEESVCPSFGACPSMGTANTMQMLGEVLNLVMPGTSTIPASDNARLRAARTAGKYMVQLARSGKTPKDLITKDVLENAIMFDMAVAGSTNVYGPLGITALIQ